jgi:hypothetical protein
MPFEAGKLSEKITYKTFPPVLASYTDIFSSTKILLKFKLMYIFKVILSL